MHGSAVFNFLGEVSLGRNKRRKHWQQKYLEQMGWQWVSHQEWIVVGLGRVVEQWCLAGWDCAHLSRCEVEANKEVCW